MMIRRLVQLYVGLLFYGLSSAMMVRADFGLNPWDVFHQGVADRTPFSFGTVVIVTGAVILVLWIPLRQRPGIGTISNMIVIGLAADLGLWLLPNVESLTMRIAMLAAGIVLNGVATSAYIGTGLGPGPRDGLMTGLAARTGRPIGAVRTGIELTVLAVGEHGPSKLKLVVKKGPPLLLDSEWELESNYGELLARKTKASSTKTLAQLYAGAPDPTLNEWNGSFTAAARMVMPDPVIVAASNGEPCSEQTRTAVAEATAVMVQRVYSVNGATSSTDDTTLTSAATCGPGANTWTVKFKLDISRLSNTISLQCQGAVKAPAGAMFATYNVTCSGDSPLNIMNKALRFKWNSSLKSSVTPLK